MAHYNDPSCDDLAWHSAEESLPSLPNEQDRPDDFLDYVDYTTEWPVKPRVDPVKVEARRKLTKIQDNLKQIRTRRNEVVQKMTSRRIPSPRSGLIKRLRVFEISVILKTVINSLASSNFDLGMKEAEKALEVAQRLEDKVTLARCYYWMGRIEFKRENIAAAHAYFKNALPCVENDECAEGNFVEFWFNISRSGIGGQYRKRAVSDHNRYVVEKFGKPKPPLGSSSTISEKRKYQEQGEITLRAGTARDSGRRQAQTDQRHKQNRLVPWRIPDIDNETSDASIHCQRKFSGPAETEWPPTQFHPPLPWKSFTFQCYPRGLSPRTRPTKIFRPHPWEIIYTAKSWEILHQRATGKLITMTWLANERKLNGEIIYKRLREARRRCMESTGPEST
ncbi:uncharacterized protein N7498_008385 [Penicillium cinerascens]|uniref:Uncharacterized protein n=1 Tax=Penicillium cinerascens TaxID=70096 RepID=A0A9W9MC78_9EURO|nr:uncharacterized protein N7498_008385 [Penicillium cinerascens]KAJ5194947.1 hypothetical protein N7498_008385 [Penicillium cinerascens]